MVVGPPVVRAAAAVLKIGIDGSSAPGAAVDSTVIESGDVGSCVALDEDGVRLVLFQETKVSFVEQAVACLARRVVATRRALSVLLSEVAASHVVKLPLRTLVRTVAQTASRVRRLRAEVINPRRACAARVTVVVLCVSQCVQASSPLLT